MLFPSISYAENESILSMEELSIQIMPEYTYHPNDKKKDHPPLLIGYQGTMVNNSDEPQKGQIEIALPMNHKNFRIGYVADYSANLQKAYEIEYSIDREKGTISWTTSEEIKAKDRYKFVIEFYTDDIKVNGKKKSLTYDFTSFADIALVNVSFIQPFKAKNMELTPAPVEEQNHSEGNKTVSYLFQGVKVGETKSFTLNYLRSESKPTVEVEQASTTKKKENQQSPYLTIGVVSGISVLAFGTFLLVRRNRKKQQ